MPDYAGEDLEGENKKSADPGTFGETPQTFPPYVLEPKPTKPETGADKTPPEPETADEMAKMAAYRTSLAKHSEAYSVSDVEGEDKGDTCIVLCDGTSTDTVYVQSTNGSKATTDSDGVETQSPAGNVVLESADRHENCHNYYQKVGEMVGAHGVGTFRQQIGGEYRACTGGDYHLYTGAIMWSR